MLSKKETILVIDDEPEIVENCRRMIQHAGYHCLTTSDPTGISQILEVENVDLVLTDLKMPAKDGLEVLQEIKILRPKVPVILFTAYATWETAVAALKDGAFDYISKPFSAEQLLTLIEKVFREKRLMEENQQLKQELGIAFGFDALIGTSSQLKSVLALVKKVAPTDANILIQGESGTGKELIARAVHRNSTRGQAGGRFVPVDCASLPETLLESELFGYEKGAFTDAQSTKPGLLESADGGTLFLDEIGEMPLSLQAKFLRVLQEKQFRRLGSNRLIHSDFRIIAATNRNLTQEVQEKRFREDLYYRLNVIHIQVPPLRERKGDIELLLRHFIREMNKKNGTNIQGVALPAMKLLESYSWPGNVRELENVVERAVSLTNSEIIGVEDLPETVRAAKQNGNLLNGRVVPFKEAKSKSLKNFYQTYFQNLLSKHGGNISRAAEEAGIDRKTIHRLLSRYKIPFPKNRESI